MNDCLDDLQCLLEHASDLAQVVSRDGILHYTNPTWLRTLAYSAAEVDNLSFWQVLHPDDRDRYRILCANLQPNQNSGPVQFTLLTRLGHAVLVEGTIGDRTLAGVRSHLWSLWRMVPDADLQPHVAPEAETVTLSQMQERYHLATRAAKVGVWEWNVATGEFYLDPNVKALLGYTDAEIPNDLNLWVNYVHPEDRQPVMAAAQAHLDGHTPEYVFEHRMLHKDGSIRWIMVRGMALRNDQGAVVCMVGTDTDITDRKRAEDEVKRLNADLEQQVHYRTAALQQANQNLAQAQQDLQAQKDFLQRVIDAISSSIFVKDREGRFLLANQAMADSHNASLESILGKRLGEFDDDWDKDQIQVFRQEDERIMRTGQPLVKEDCVVVSGQPPRWYQTTLKPFFDPQGQVQGLLGNAVDITAHKAAETALRDSENRFQRMAANVPGMLYQYVLHPDGSDAFTYVSPQCKAIYELSPQEMMQDTSAVWKMMHPDDVALIHQANARSIQTLEPFDAYFRLTPPSGRLKWIHTKSSPERQTNGDLVFDGLVMDVSDHKAVEAVLRENQELMGLFFHQSLHGFFFMMLDEPIRWDETTDKEAALDYVFMHQRIARINSAMLTQYGATEAQFMGLTPADFFAHDLEYGKNLWRQFFDAGRLHIETEERKFDGTPMFIEGDYTCLYDLEGRITGNFGVQRDVSDRKAAEVALKISEQRLQSVIRSAPVILFTLDQNERVTFCDGQGLEALGLQPGDLVGLTPLEIYPDKPDIAEAVSRALAGEVVIYEKNIHGIHYSSRYNPLLDNQGNVVGMIGVALDITDKAQLQAERLQAQAALYQTEQRLRQVIDSASVVIYALD
ncbi:MAG: PAS domain-containing protein, partial [Thermosynechococcaceae cyanobacterium]